MHRAVLLLAILGARAHASPRVDLGRCTAYDATKLQKAIAGELAAQPETPYTVLVECADLVTAKLRIAPEPPDGPIERIVDLGEVACELRMKLLALAVSELVDVAAGLTPPKPPSAVTPPPPRSQPDITVALAAPPTANHSAVDESFLVRKPPPHERDWWEGLLDGDRVLTVRAGARAFIHDYPYTFGTLGVEVGEHRIRVGLEAGVTQRSVGASDSNSFHDGGLIRAWLGTLTVAYDVYCADHTCAVVRAAGGGELIHNHGSYYRDYKEVVGAYGALAVDLEYRVSRTPLYGAIELGYTAGFVAHYNDAYLMRTDGATVAAFVGARF